MQLQLNGNVLTAAQTDLINRKAAAVLAAHPAAMLLYATIDGQIFLPKEKNAAANWAKKLKQTQLIEVLRNETPVTKTEIITELVTAVTETPVTEPVTTEPTVTKGDDANTGNTGTGKKNSKKDKP